MQILFSGVYLTGCWFFVVENFDVFSVTIGFETSFRVKRSVLISEKGASFSTGSGGSFALCKIWTATRNWQSSSSTHSLKGLRACWQTPTFVPTKQGRHTAKSCRMRSWNVSYFLFLFRRRTSLKTDSLRMRLSLSVTSFSFPSVFTSAQTSSKAFEKWIYSKSNRIESRLKRKRSAKEWDAQDFRFSTRPVVAT